MACTKCTGMSSSMGFRMMSLSCLFWFESNTQLGHDESNKIVEDMEKTIAASLFDTYRVRSHLVPNPTNSKLIRLKK